MADGVTALHLPDMKTLDDGTRRADFFHDFNSPANAHDFHFRKFLMQKYTNGCFLCRNGKNGVGRIDGERNFSFQLALEIFRQLLPQKFFVRVLQSQFETSGGNGVSVNGKARAVRAAAAHAVEHSAEPFAEARLQRFFLKKEADDAAHKLLR